MKLEKIITQANANVCLEFRAMERSLRATGCTLPLLVLPYDDKTFDLPENASWWSDPAIAAWLKERRTHPGYMKYHCLTSANYQFVDTDVVFLRNPEEALGGVEGFVACCGHWRDPAHAITGHSKEILSALSTNWQRKIFNAGQFACDRALYSFEKLRETAEDRAYRQTALDVPFHEQAGLNLLVGLSQAPFTNLTLPPQELESSWAGDYPADFEKFWTDAKRKPYLIHWAGGIAKRNYPINELFLSFLSVDERAEWRGKRNRAEKHAWLSRKLFSR